MRSHDKWLLTALLAGLFVTPVFGQPPVGGNVLEFVKQGVDEAVLLRTPSVQKEIKLTDEQAEKFRKIAQDVQNKRRGDVRKTIQEMRDKINKAVPYILGADQVKRLHQIKLQTNGILSFNQPEVQQKLKLTDKQKEEVQGINDDAKKDIGNRIKESKNLRERMEALRMAPQRMKAATGKAVAVLNDEQKKMWNEMIGEKFEFKIDLMPGGQLP